MGNTVFVNGREVAHKASSGRQMAVWPDVCKGPSVPPPPAPIPYPDIAMSDGARTNVGSKKVKVASKPAVTTASKMAASRGNEAGTAAAKGLVTAKTAGQPVNAAPPVRCGNPACRFSRQLIPATQTARLPADVRVDFPDRLVCLECYRKIVGREPMPAGSAQAAPFIPGGSVVQAADGGVRQGIGGLGRSATLLNRLIATLGKVALVTHGLPSESDIRRILAGNMQLAG